jgi:hypothetical protein
MLKMMIDDEEDEKEGWIQENPILYIFKSIAIVSGTIYTLLYYNTTMYSITGFTSWSNSHYGINLMIQLFVTTLYMIESITTKKVIIIFSNLFVLIGVNLLFVISITMTAVFSQYGINQYVTYIFNYTTILLSPILIINFEILYNECCMMNFNLPIVSIGTSIGLIFFMMFFSMNIFTAVYTYTFEVFKEKFWLIILIFSIIMIFPLFFLYNSK